jgi:hypothetical protein
MSSHQSTYTKHNYILANKRPPHTHGRNINLWGLFAKISLFLIDPQNVPLFFKSLDHEHIIAIFLIFQIENFKLNSHN